jgi:hypothetical protein
LLWCPEIAPALDGDGEPLCDGIRLWSDATSWADSLKRVPVAGDNVYIRKNCHYIYDYTGIEQILNSIIVEGTLTWATTGSLILNTKFFFIRGGHVLIGKDTTDFFSGSLAEIVLHGD